MCRHNRLGRRRLRCTQRVAEIAERLLRLGGEVVASHELERRVEWPLSGEEHQLPRWRLHDLVDEERFDLVIVDSTDPIGPATPLFGAEFYGNVKRILVPGGLVVSQAESPSPVASASVKSPTRSCRASSTPMMRCR